MKKIDNKSWSQGFMNGALCLGLLVLSGQFLYKLSQEMLFEAKILSGILGALCLIGAIYLFIKFAKRLKK